MEGEGQDIYPKCSPLASLAPRDSCIPGLGLGGTMEVPLALEDLP